MRGPVEMKLSKRARRHRVVRRAGPPPRLFPLQLLGELQVCRTSVFIAQLLLPTTATFADVICNIRGGLCESYYMETILYSF